jgi:hypothetical protein
MGRSCLVLLAGCGFHAGTPFQGSAAGDAPGQGFDGPSSDGQLRDAASDGRALDGVPDAAPVPVRYVQGGSSSGTGTSVSFQLGVDETLGDLNVVGVSWASTGVTVTSVTDSDGNSYTQMSGSPIVLSGSGVLAVYYAADVRQGVARNTVTVSFSSSTGPILMVAEYAGLAVLSPLDASNTDNASSGTAATSGNVSTAHAHDLLVGIGAAGATMTGGAGYTTRVGANLDLIEDREVIATGSYSATATLSSSNGWTFAILAFQAQ